MTNKVNGENIPISQATGSIYRMGNRVFLVTNWHVLSGRHAITKQTLHKNAALPEIVKIYFPVDGTVYKQISREFVLKDERGEYLWLEHPHSNIVDVAALEITIPDGIANFTIDGLMKPNFESWENFLYVSQDVWVIGFPIGIKVGGLPIWKRATIAAVPSLAPTDNKYKIILDTATREGMSGSPVLFVNKTLTPIQFDGMEQEVDLPSLRVMFGIYSGRIAGDDELSAQLGIAWSCNCIPELISSNKKYNEQQ